MNDFNYIRVDVDLLPNIKIRNAIFVVNYTVTGYIYRLPCCELRFLSNTALLYISVETIIERDNENALRKVIDLNEILNKREVVITPYKSFRRIKATNQKFLTTLL